jgi:tRNA(Ile)-lysidine synthase
MQDAAEILAEVVAEDLRRCQSLEGLSVAALACLSAARQRQLIAHWMQGEQVYAPPLHRVSAVLQLASTRGVGQVLWQDWQFRYYHEQLYRLPKQALSPPPPAMAQISLQFGQVVTLPSGSWQVQSAVDGLPLQLLGRPLQLVARVGGERLHLEGRIGHWPLKKFLQQLGLPVWQRDQVQLLRTTTADEAVTLAVLTAKGCFLTTAMRQPQQASWRLQRV